MTENQRRRFEDRIQANPLDWNDAQAEKSSTAGAAKGGNTSDNGSQASSVLTEERIDELGRTYDIQAFRDLEYRSGLGCEMTWGEKERYQQMLGFARAIEAEVLAQAGVRAEPATPLQFDADELRKLILHVSNTSHWCGQIGGDADDYEDHLNKAVAADEALFNYVKNLAAPTTPAQVPAAEVRAQALDLEKLTRYEFSLYEQDMTSVENGDYVKLSDVRALIAQSSTADKASEVRAALERDAARYHQMKENDFTAEYCAYIGDCLNERETVDLDVILDGAAMAAAPSTADSGNTDEKGGDK